jgi:Cu-Zn family superoxide dismutase
MAVKRLGILVIALLLAATAGLAVTLAQDQPDEYILPGDEVYPEGIAVQESTGNFFVSSTTDGTIFRGHVDDPDTEVFLPGGEDGRVVAVGLAVDNTGRLFIAGGPSELLFVYDTESGDLLAALDAPGGFFNDVAVTSSGDAYFTNSMIPVLYRVTQDADGEYILEEWLDLEGTAIEYVEGFNLNGIVVTPDDQYLIVIQSNTGQLFRIEIATGDVVEIDTGDVELTAGDGLVLQE